MSAVKANPPPQAFVDDANVVGGRKRKARERVNPPPQAFVDGNNVMGSRPDGWWRDRDAAQRRLIADLEAAARGSGREWTLVFDGAPPSRARGEASAPPGASASSIRGNASTPTEEEESAPPEEAAGASPDGVRVEHAKRKGANAADDRIIEMLDALPEGTDAVVYTSDRRLRERAAALGARVEGAGALLRRVAAPGGGGAG